MSFDEHRKWMKQSEPSWRRRNLSVGEMKTASHSSRTNQMIEKQGLFSDDMGLL